MIGLLTRLMGRLPLGWLQLFHSRMRLLSALAGVAFANILVLVQLGIMGALNNSILISYDLLDADIMISAEDANTLTEGGNVARQRMFQAMSVGGVESAMPLSIGNVEWTLESGDTATLVTIGIDPQQLEYVAGHIAEAAMPLRLLDVALLDTATRGVPEELLAAVSPTTPLRFEANGRTLLAVDTFAGGGGFTGDGFMIVSDQTFLSLFPKRSSGAPNHILIKTAGNVSTDAVVKEIQAKLSDTGLRVRSFRDAALQDQAYQTTERPTGLIFGFGVVIGILVGIVIVYQVLSTDVADHLGEYATFKAMGYGQGFFLGVIFEQALILACLGFVPGIVGSLLIYQGLSSATGLPLILTVPTALAVFAGTVGACMLSGAIATRRLASADPADLF